MKFYQITLIAAISIFLSFSTQALTFSNRAFRAPDPDSSQHQELIRSIENKSIEQQLLGVYTLRNLILACRKISFPTY